MGILPKSIRWRLQLWYGLILLVVLAGFGLTADRLDRGRQLRRVDEELQQRVAVLAAALRPPPAGPGPGMGGGRHRPGGPPRNDEFDLPAPRERGGEGRGDERELPGVGEPGRRLGPFRRELRLSPEDASLFDREASPFYYVVWARDGRILSQSAKAPLPIPAPLRGAAGGFPLARTRGELREGFGLGGPGDLILVGRSMAPDLAEMNRRTAWLTMTGLAVMGFGLAGGWWLAGRAIRPVESIGATAERIASGDLSRRIDLTETESELGQLAVVLNSTFARLEAAFLQQTRFTSDAAHELRTPVTVLLTQTQMALARERTAGEYRETLEACQRAAQRMRRLIESLLALARLDAGREPMAPTTLDLAAIARDCVDLVRPLAGERGVMVEVDLPALPCVGDVNGLSQVVTNLLTNAIQYNREGGKVWVRGEVRAGLVTLAVLDTGIGISPEDRAHVFERFYRADSARTGGSNAGLGLAISKAIVDRHGGTIVCEPRVGPPGETGGGSIFTVRLPAAPALDAAPTGP